MSVFISSKNSHADLYRNILMDFFITIVALTCSVLVVVFIDIYDFTFNMS